MTAEEKLQAANRRAAENRAAFLANVATLKARVAPDRLKADAVSKVRSVALETKDRTVDTVRAHPFAIAAGVTAVSAYVFRRPLLRLARRIPLPDRLRTDRLRLPRFWRAAPEAPPALPAPRSWLKKLPIPYVKVAIMVARHYLTKSLRRIKHDREDA